MQSVFKHKAKNEFRRNPYGGDVCYYVLEQNLTPRQLLSWSQILTETHRWALCALSRRGGTRTLQWYQVEK